MAIVIKDLSFSFGRNRVLNNLTLNIKEGKFTVILGKNGSGKSTLLKLIAGLLPITEGQILVHGKDLKKLKDYEKASLIGYLPQIHDPIFPFNVEDVIITGRASFSFPVPNNNDWEIVEDVIKKIGISKLKNRPYTALSGGERQLVMIARLLAQQPKVILLDEPLSFLDLHNQSNLMKIIKSLVLSGLTVVSVLHDPNIAIIHADDIILIKDGEVINTENGSSKTISKKTLDYLYDVDLEFVPYKDKGIVLPVL